MNRLLTWQVQQGQVRIVLGLLHLPHALLILGQLHVRRPVLLDQPLHVLPVLLDLLVSVGHVGQGRLGEELIRVSSSKTPPGALKVQEQAETGKLVLDFVQTRVYDQGEE